MVLVYDLRGCILAEAVDDAVHQDVLTQQRHRTFLTVEHGEFLREELRYIKVIWPFHRSFIRDLHLNDAVNAKLCNLLPMIVEADEIVCIVVPKHGKRGDRVDLSAAPEHPLLGRRVVEITEGDFLPLRDGGLDAVYADVDAVVDGFYAAVDVHRCRSSNAASPGTTKVVSRLTSSLLFPGVMNRADCTASMRSLTSGASK